jgi:hypothetical protein
VGIFTFLQGFPDEIKHNAVAVPFPFVGSSLLITSLIQRWMILRKVIRIWLSFPSKDEVSLDSHRPTEIKTIGVD